MGRARTTKPVFQPALQELAQLQGVETAYEDVFGQRREASPDSLLRVLQVLGVPVQRAADATDALRAHRCALWSRGLEPVNLAWDGRSDGIVVRLPRKQTSARWGCTLRTEQGEERRWDVEADKLATVESVRVERGSYVAKLLPVPGPLPHGYHRLVVDTGGQSLQTLIISAPLRAYTPDGLRTPAARTWGVFLPLYALHSSRSWGAGDFNDLRRLLSWVHEQGGGVAATLALMAAFLDEPFECSPFSPVSRLFWNELYLDVEALPELERCPAARVLLASPEFAREKEALRALRQVAYRRLMALKRRVLAELARCFFQEANGRREAFERFVAEHPQVNDYAQFRAVGERLRTPWPQWPAALRDGDIRPSDYDEEACRYHLYVQWTCEQQLHALAAEARRTGPGLYLDLPLGVDVHGYDVWRQRDAFAVEAAGGAPPDAIYTKGQDWGFPPLHPARIREQGYRYVLDYLRRQLCFAGVLRIDHMPVFHRLFWIPRGLDASQGVYVRYPAEELYAVFSLESHRHKAMLVGEDLGTVPPEVPASMARHNVHRMYMVQYCLQADPKEALPEVPAASIASINTHDMPSFAAFWAGEDIRQREELGILGDQGPEKELEKRRAMIEALVATLRTAGRLGDTTDVADVLRACLCQLAASDARIVLVNLEDLWLETQPQNVPSTGSECSNWRNKARYALEQFRETPQVLDTLREIDHLMRAK
jgi:4-alpha-glucanotransferase